MTQKGWGRKTQDSNLAFWIRKKKMMMKKKKDLN